MCFDGEFPQVFPQPITNIAGFHCQKFPIYAQIFELLRILFGSLPEIVLEQRLFVETTEYLRTHSLDDLKTNFGLDYEEVIASRKKKAEDELKKHMETFTISLKKL